MDPGAAGAARVRRRRDPGAAARPTPLVDRSCRSCATSLPRSHEDARHLAVLSDAARPAACGPRDTASMVEAAAEPRFLPGCLCGERGARNERGRHRRSSSITPSRSSRPSTSTVRLHGWTSAAAPSSRPGSRASLIGAIGVTALLPPRAPALAGAGERRRAARRGRARGSGRPSRDRALRGSLSRSGRAVTPAAQRARNARGGRVLAATPPGWLGDRLDLPATSWRGDALDGGPRLAIEPLGPDGNIVWDAGAQARTRPGRGSTCGRSTATRPRSSCSASAILLGKRHSEMVVLLALTPPRDDRRGAGPRPVRREQGREVTVRAEMARLRRRLGPMVASQPYRLDRRRPRRLPRGRSGWHAVARSRRRWTLYVGPLLPGSRRARDCGGARAHSRRRARAGRGGRTSRATGCNPLATLTHPSERALAWPVACSPRSCPATKEGK